MVSSYKDAVDRGAKRKVLTCDSIGNEARVRFVLFVVVLGYSIDGLDGVPLVSPRDNLRQPRDIGIRPKAFLCGMIEMARLRSNSFSAYFTAGCVANSDTQLKPEVVRSTEEPSPACLTNSIALSSVARYRGEESDGTISFFARRGCLVVLVMVL